MRHLLAAAVALGSLVACGTAPASPGLSAPTPYAGDPRLHRAFDLPAGFPSGGELAADHRGSGVWFLSTTTDGRPAAAHWDASTSTVTTIVLRGYHGGGSLALDGDRALWVAGGTGVLRVDLATRLDRSWWPPQPGRGLPPDASGATMGGVAPDGHGRLAIAYTGVAGVVFLDGTTGVFSTTPVAGLTGATAVAYAGDGTLGILGMHHGARQPDTLVLLAADGRTRALTVQGTVLRPEPTGFVVSGAVSGSSVEITTAGVSRTLHVGEGDPYPLPDGRYVSATRDGLVIADGEGGRRHAVDFPVLCCVTPFGDDVIERGAPAPTPVVPIPYRVQPNTLAVDGTGVVWMTVYSPTPQVVTLASASV